LSLQVALFMGSARAAKPFWGGLPPRVCDRVVKLVLSRVAELNKVAAVAAQLEVEVLDPLAFPSVMSFAALDGNPSYYAAKASTWLARGSVVILSSTLHTLSASRFSAGPENAARGCAAPRGGCRHGRCVHHCDARVRGVISDSLSL